MTSSPDPRRRLTSDELIAMFVAFLGIGSVLFWGWTQKESGFDLGSLSGSLFSAPNATQPPSPATTLLPSPNASPSTIGIAPNTSGSQSPGAIALNPQVEDPAINPSAAIVAPSPSVNPPAIVAPAAPSPDLPNLVPSPTTPPRATGATGFSDVPQTYWASGYIAELSRRNILGGFPDGTFQPDKPITRAEFAGLVGKAFDKPRIRQGLGFQDLAADYWAKGAIDEAVQTGFMNGYPDGVFQPDQQIPMLQLQTALASGLKLQPQTPAAQTLARFEDANQVPKWAQEKIAAAVEAGLVSGFPSPKQLTPNRVATRADAAALLYQALVKEGRVTPAR